VLADGILSTGRRFLFPDVEPSYSGYVAWRGTVPEHAVAGAALQALDDTITYVLMPNSHMLVYPIPGSDGSIEFGRRRWNFVWYRNVESGRPLADLMTDRDGLQQKISLHPGRVRRRYVAELKDLAAQNLPASVSAIVLCVDEPFVQVVMDVKCPSMVVGRVCILGDAAFAARPHAAAGTAKAAENAWTLADALAGAEDVDRALQGWSRSQTALGRRLVARSKRLGDGSQFRTDWRPGDPGLRFGLYEPGDSSIWTADAAASRSSPHSECLTQ
jgi:2,6-dihydroxypyridine 3-monooxygenase